MASHIQTTTDRKSVLWRSSGYRSACGPPPATAFWEAHHVTCNHAVEGRVITPAYAEYVEDCLWITDWDLNAAANLIGLPTNKQYRTSDGKLPVNLCSHQVDHNTKAGYTDECKKWLKDNVWDTLKDKRKAHEVSAKAIKSQLDQCTSTFKQKLTTRGLRGGGTLTAWADRHKPANATKWYLPFSMGENPSQRSPGANTKAMAGIFKKIG